MTGLGYSARVVLQTTNYIMLEKVKLQQNYPKESILENYLEKGEYPSIRKCVFKTCHCRLLSGSFSG